MPPTWYSVVINNPTPQDEADINSAKTLGWLVEGQLEVGKNGTPHYQLAVGTNEPWKVLKGHFPRANIQEAEDPVALRKYVVKEATRVLDLTAAPKERKRAPPQGSAAFYEDVFEEAYTQFGLGVDEMIKADSTLKVYDMAVNQLILEKGYDIAVRATRPDVRAAYRKYRYAMWSVWYHKNIPAEDIEDADDNEGLEQDAGGSVVEEHDDTEASDSEAEGSTSDEGSDEGSQEDSEGDGGD